MNKTNAMRLLDSRKIAYRVTEYDTSGEFHPADEAAALIGAPVETVYKTLVVLPAAKGKPILVMIQADKQLDLKKLARELGEKKLAMAKHDEAEKLTGLQAGGISALALLNRGFRICIDASARQFEKIHISAGVRGVDIEIRVEDLVKVTSAKVVEMVE